MANPILCCNRNKKNNFSIIHNDVTYTISDGWLSVYT